MAYFPMFIDLNNQTVLVVGGGTVAFRKVQKLMQYGAKMIVVAPEISEEIESVSGVILKKREFQIEDLESEPVMVIAATNRTELNQKISLVCRERHIPINVVDNVDNCSFVFPALLINGDFSAGICTGGASPTASVYYKERLQSFLPENLDEILKWLEEIRPELKKTIPEQAKRAGVFRKLFERSMELGRPLTWEEWKNDAAVPKMGSVALVGAGCGKADLITVRGLRLLQQCEAVVYDDLIDLELLEAVPESAQRIYMGKRSGAHSAPQEAISAMLIRLAKEGKKVVRLKGGDPYLFGRGGEEMQALLEAGIPCQEVPGIPSAIGIPAEAGIPVTHRGASRGLHIITAHTSDTEDGLPEDFDALAELSGTLVFLMGLRQLPKIVRRLMTAGKSGDTPAAVISGGNSKTPARVRSTLAGLEEAVQKAKVSSPAVILVGDVAALNLNSVKKPLEHIRIGITGTERIAEKQKRLLEEQGAETKWICRSVVKERKLPFDFHELIRKPCWLVFTSANGVKIFFKQLEEQKINCKEWKNLKFAVIGTATGKVLASYGIHAEICPNIFTSEALANALISEANPEEEIILLRSSVGSPLLSEIPRRAGFVVKDIALYDLEAGDDRRENLEAIDYLTFSSAGGVRLFFEQYQNIPEQTKCVCIGDVTAKEFRNHSEKPVLLAKEALVEEMMYIIMEDCAR